MQTGKRHLAGFIGDQITLKEFVHEKIKNWHARIQLLSTAVVFCPRASFTKSFNLSTNNGGLGIQNSVVKASEQFEMPKQISILISDSNSSGMTLEVNAHKIQNRGSKQKFQLENEPPQSNTCNGLLEQACTSERKRMERNFKTGNSCWLTAKMSDNLF